MKFKTEGKKKVEKFLLDDPGDTTIYENLLNSEKVIITRDEFFTDKNGKSYITVWYQISEE